MHEVSEEGRAQYEAWLDDKLNAALKQTLRWLCERADDGRVEVEADEFGVVFEMYEDGARMVGTIDDAGQVTWL